MKPYGHKIGADSNWGVGRQENAIKGRGRAQGVKEIMTQLKESNEKEETRGRKPLAFADRVANVPLRLLPREIEEIKRKADAEGISAMAWKQRAIRAAFQPPAGSP